MIELKEKIKNKLNLQTNIAQINIYDIDLIQQYFNSFEGVEKKEVLKELCDNRVFSKIELQEFKSFYNNLQPAYQEILNCNIQKYSHLLYILKLSDDMSPYDVLNSIFNNKADYNLRKKFDNVNVNFKIFVDNLSNPWMNAFIKKTITRSNDLFKQKLKDNFLTDINFVPNEILNEILEKKLLENLNFKQEDYFKLFSNIVYQTYSNNNHKEQQKLLEAIFIKNFIKYTGFLDNTDYISYIENNTLNSGTENYKYYILPFMASVITQDLNMAKDFYNKYNKIKFSFLSFLKAPFKKSYKDDKGSIIFSSLSGLALTTPVNPLLGSISMVILGLSYLLSTIACDDFKDNYFVNSFKNFYNNFKNAYHNDVDQKNGSYIKKNLSQRIKKFFDDNNLKIEETQPKEFSIENLILSLNTKNKSSNQMIEDLEDEIASVILEEKQKIKTDKILNCIFELSYQFSKSKKEAEEIKVLMENNPSVSQTDSFINMQKTLEEINNLKLNNLPAETVDPILSDILSKKRQDLLNSATEQVEQKMTALKILQAQK